MVTDGAAQRPRPPGWRGLSQPSLPRSISRGHTASGGSRLGRGGSRYLRGSPERFTVLANITSSPGELTGSSEIINN